MLNLIFGILAICSSFGIFISKTQIESGVKKQRQHTQPLQLDKEI
jgi:hypothetical protein